MMTTPRDDISGLSERLREDFHRGEITLWNTLPEAATQLDSLLKERDALQAERDKWDRRVAYDELKAREYENRATQQRQIDAITIRAETAEQERDALQARVKELEDDRNFWKSERDEAYERAIQAVRSAPSPDANGFVVTKDAAIKAILRLSASPEKEGKSD